MEVSSLLRGRHKVVARPPDCPKGARLENLSAVGYTDVAQEASTVAMDVSTMQQLFFGVFGELRARRYRCVYPWVKSHPDCGLGV